MDYLGLVPNLRVLFIPPNLSYSPNGMSPTYVIEVSRSNLDCLLAFQDADRRIAGRLAKRALPFRIKGYPILPTAWHGSH